MTPERWQLIKSVLSEALEIEPEQRTAFLAKVCGRDAEIKAEVESLLSEQEAAHSFIEEAAFDRFSLSDDDSHLPYAVATQPEVVAENTERRIGNYKILCELAQGGMGAVYLAERDDSQYRQRVAIKIIKHGMDSDFVLRRFRAERQILAALNHPHIARLIDGGATPDGSPYLVMEYIEGLPLDQYCDRHKLSIIERVKLFRQVCAAVQYAHQRLIIHRDLKPGNMLVTTDGVVKLLDFGIAKLLTGELEGQQLDATATGVRLMTPAYASPEQVREEPVTTVSDVYSLGVVLYELLTGCRPYQLKTTQPQELLRIICEQEPTRPSARTATRGEATRSVTALLPPRVAASQLKGDLDNIVLMAMRKEPERRYASVEQLDEDLRRYLAELPVSARRDTISYRSGKFIKRHKLPVLAAGLILVTLIASIVMTTRARKQAERRFDEVRLLAKAVVFDYNDAIEKLPGSLPIRQRIVSDALKYLDGLSREKGNDPVLSLELAEAYQRIGNIQGNSSYSNLGDTEGALVSYRKALALQEALAQSDAGNTVVQAHLALTCTLIGDVLSEMGKLNEALVSYQRALPLRKAAVAANPDDVEAQRNLAKLLLSLGDISGNDGWPNLGNTAAAADYYHQSLMIREALVATHPQNTDLQRDWYDGLLPLGDIKRTLGDVEGAIQTYRQALALIEKLSAADPHNVYRQQGIANAALRLGRLLNEQERAAEGLDAINKAVKVMEALAAAESANASFKRNLSVTYNHAAVSLLQLKRPTEALAFARKSMAIIKALVLADGSNKFFRSDLALTHRRQGDAFAQLHDWPAALREHQQALALQEEMNREEPGTALRETMAISQGRIAEILARSGKARSSIAYYNKSLTNYEALFAAGLHNTITRRDYAESLARAAGAYAKLGIWQEAHRTYQHSREVYTELQQQQVLLKNEADKLNELAREIAKCEAVLGR